MAQELNPYQKKMLEQMKGGPVLIESFVTAKKASDKQKSKWMCQLSDAGYAGWKFAEKRGFTLFFLPSDPEMETP